MQNANPSTVFLAKPTETLLHPLYPRAQSASPSCTFISLFFSLHRLQRKYPRKSWSSPSTGFIITLCSAGFPYKCWHQARKHIFVFHSWVLVMEPDRFCVNIVGKRGPSILSLMIEPNCRISAWRCITKLIENTLQICARAGSETFSPMPDAPSLPKHATVSFITIILFQKAKTCPSGIHLSYGIQESWTSWNISWPLNSEIRQWIIKCHFWVSSAMSI